MIEMENLSKTYTMGSVKVHALRDVNLHVAAGESLAIVGPSGSGKTTLMNIIGCLDVPTSGRYRLEGREVGRLSDNELAAVRNRKIGFVFQSFNLLPRLSALENVERPLIYRGLGRRERQERARTALTRVGLADRLQHRPTELSGGQQQRVAVARALAGDPAIILADEPTGNLDSSSGRDLINLLQELNAGGKTLLVITHDAGVAAMARRRVFIHDGYLTDGEVTT